jgi:ABC-type transport system involved in multi-copper enzyme maturation permease subunit
MRKIAAIALVTLQEAIRQRLAVNLFVFGLALIGAALTISGLTFGEQYRIIVSLGLSSMEIFGTLIAVFLGAGLIARDVERRSVYPVITKPVSRAQYVLGRYAGLVVTTTLNLLVMAVLFVAVLALDLGTFAFLTRTPIAPTILAMVVQFAMVGAIATFFSSFSTATFSAVFTLSLVVAGHVASDLVRYWSQQGPVAGVLGKVAYALVPNLEALNLKEAVVYRDPVTASFLVTGVGYGVLYSAAVLALTVAVFSHRDLR